jgi:DNA-binding response OmpR family regulator
MTAATPTTNPVPDAKAPSRILLVEDDLDMGKLLHGALKQAALDTTMVGSGETALRRLAGELFDLILLDIRLPGISGMEVCRQVKADLRLRHIPVIFISGLHDNQMRAQAFMAGAAEFIAKPFTMQQFQACVTRQLTLPSLRQRSLPPNPPPASR